jgi:hypothetical protein
VPPFNPVMVPEPAVSPVNTVASVGHPALTATQATFRVVSTLAVEGAMGVTTIWPELAPGTADCTVGGFNEDVAVATAEQISSPPLCSIA